MDPRVRQALVLIEKNLEKNLDPDEIASRFNLSTSRLRHLIKDEAGTTITQYRKKLKMQKAKSLLETTFLNVKQIMLSVGYKDKSNFVREFKGYYGLTPAKYRSHYLKEIERESRAIATFTNR